jgi:His-Xaa-Ser system protein HxsD
MLRSKINKEENKIVVSVNPEIYPLEAIYGAAYVFLDKAYLFLDGNPKNQVMVTIKGKGKLNKKQLKDLAGEFYNELLNCALRDKISQANQKIRELIVARALFSAQEFPEEKVEKKPKKEKWEKDTLGIALPWEEKYGKKEKKKK